MPSDQPCGARLHLQAAGNHRVGVVPLGLDVPKNPVFMRVSGLGTFRVTVFATDKIVPPWLAIKPKNRIFFKAFALFWADAFLHI